jgi:AcrR family transcriptional regulator
MELTQGPMGVAVNPARTSGRAGTATPAGAIGGAKPDNDLVSTTANTRTRIQRIALELFIEHGYEATSLREIAERLGVTKAALYYHFKTKEEIVTSLVDDRVAALDEIIAWAQSQPRTTQMRRELILRYSNELLDRLHHDTMRFMERNPTALKDQPATEKMRERMIGLVQLLSDGDDPLTKRLKGSLAIFAIHASWFTLRDPSITDEQRQVAAIEVALELIGAAGPAGAEAGATAAAGASPKG